MKCRYSAYKRLKKIRIATEARRVFLAKRDKLTRDIDSMQDMLSRPPSEIRWNDADLHNRMFDKLRAMELQLKEMNNGK